MYLDVWMCRGRVQAQAAAAEAGARARGARVRVRVRTSRVLAQRRFVKRAERAPPARVPEACVPTLVLLSYPPGLTY